MANPDDIINLNNFSNLTQDELKQKVLEWIRGNGISEKLHSQLRCDLIASFNKTLLGRYIESQFQSEYRMVLSPVILSLNILVSEFLYAQNCHYTLSVFSTEVPFKNILPEFEKHDHFQFSKTELNEIFGALGMESKETRDRVSTSYYKNQSKGNNSLLFYIFQNILNKNTSNKVHQADKSNSQMNYPPDDPRMCSHCETFNFQKTSNYAIDKNNLKYINKYLYISIKKIYKLAKKIDKLELNYPKDYYTKEKQNPPSLDRHNELENLLVLNKSLENLTNEFKKLMNIDNIHKDSHDYNFLMLIKDVIRITNNLNEKFETCNHNVSLLLKHFTDGSINDKAVKTADLEEYQNFKDTKLNYKEWLDSIKQSKYGKKFLKKLESNFTKTLIKEKQQHKRDFQEKLEKEKSIIRLHYRQKYLEHLNKRTEQDRELETQISNAQTVVKTTKSYQHVDKELVKIDKKNNIQNINTEKDGNGRQSEKQSVLLSQHPVYNISIEPLSINEITQTTVLQTEVHKNVEGLILDTKKRIFELGKESEKLDESIQNYIQRQVSDKSKHKTDMSTILNKYNSGRVVLNTRTYSPNKASGIIWPVASNNAENPIFREMGSADETSYLNKNNEEQINSPMLLNEKHPSITHDNNKNQFKENLIDNIFKEIKKNTDKVDDVEYFNQH